MEENRRLVLRHSEGTGHNLEIAAFCGKDFKTFGVEYDEFGSFARGAFGHDREFQAWVEGEQLSETYEMLKREAFTSEEEFRQWCSDQGLVVGGDITESMLPGIRCMHMVKRLDIDAHQFARLLSKYKIEFRAWSK